MPSQGLSQSHSQDLAISLTLEDEFPELSASQVLAALQQAGGSLEAARQLCSRAVSAAACHPGSAAQQGAPQQHRKWWPASQFCPVEPLVATRSSSFGNSTATSSSAARRPLLVPHQVVPAQRSPATSGMATYQQPAMQPSAGGARGGSQPGVGQQSPATSAIRRLVGGASGDAPSSSSTAAAANVRPPGGILQRSTVAASTTGSTSSGSGSAPAGALPAAAQRRQREAAQGERQPLRPHYAAVFLTDKSRQQLLQHVPPLHEVVTADHMTVAYQPSLDECLALPLGREAALFVAGAAADYRAQAVAVEHPSWLPFLSGTPPHVTVSGRAAPQPLSCSLGCAAGAKCGGSYCRHCPHPTPTDAYGCDAFTLFTWCRAVLPSAACSRGGGAGQGGGRRDGGGAGAAWHAGACGSPQAAAGWVAGCWRGRSV